MTENGIPHLGLTEYVLDVLDADERARFERHLATCAACSAEVRELRAVSALLDRAVPGYDMPPGVELRTFAAIERAAAPPPASTRRRARRVALAFAVVALLAAVAGGAFQLLGSAAAPVELQAVLAPPRGAGAERATVEVTKTGIGREIAFASDDLPVLPKGDYYELWFVGPGDAPGHRDRISAGTFHPDPDGRSHVRFTAAVDPALYPVLSVTAEPGDGNPVPTGPEVLRSRS